MIQVKQYIDDFYTALRGQLRPVTIKGLAIVGSGVIFNYTLKILSSISSLVFARTRNHIQRYGSGSWALITGPTSGIGLAYANELARLGFNIILLGRNEDTLEIRRQEILAAYGEGILVRTVQADLLHSGEEGFMDYIESELDGLDISILVNNAGVAEMSSVQDHSDEKAHEMMQVNTIACTLLTRKLLPKMLMRIKRSAVITVSSVGGVGTHKFISYYSGCKAYLDMFSRALQIQYGDKIDFFSFRSGPVSTRAMGFTKTFWFISAEAAAHASLERMGCMSYSYGHWKHQLYGALYTNTVFGPVIYAKLLRDVNKTFTKLAATSENNKS